MAKADRVRVTGVREAQAALRKLDAQTKDLTAAHRAVAGELVPGISMRTPRRTGALAMSWSPKATKTRARISSSLPYAGVIEFGWAKRGIEPASMVRDEISAKADEIGRAYEREIARLASRDGFEVKP